MFALIRILLVDQYDNEYAINFYLLTISIIIQVCQI